MGGYLDSHVDRRIRNLKFGNASGIDWPINEVESRIPSKKWAAYSCYIRSSQCKLRGTEPNRSPCSLIVAGEWKSKECVHKVAKSDHSPLVSVVTDSHKSQRWIWRIADSPLAYFLPNQ